MEFALSKSLIASEERMKKFLQCGIDSVHVRIRLGTDSLFPSLCCMIVRKPGGAQESQLVMMPTELGTKKERIAMFRGLGSGFYERQEFPIMAALVCETWGAKCIGAPSEAPNKKELVYAVVGNLTNRTFLGSYMEIKRDEARLIQRGTFSPIKPEQECFLLQSFYEGFFAKSYAKAKNLAKERVN